MVESLTLNEEVRGSRPLLPTKISSEYDGKSRTLVSKLCRCCNNYYWTPEYRQSRSVYCSRSCKNKAGRPFMTKNGILTAKILEPLIATNKSSYQIAKILGMPQGTTHRWIKKLGFKTNPERGPGSRKYKITPCQHCGKLVRQPGRRFCSVVCHHRKRQVEQLALWKLGTFAPSECVAKGLLILERGNKCQLCGWAKINPYSKTIPIELEHIDGDCYNNKYDNLSLLCPSCHSLTPTFRGLNMNKGRGRKMYKNFSRWSKEHNLKTTA
jgi:hypothetical protein